LFCNIQLSLVSLSQPGILDGWVVKLEYPVFVFYSPKNKVLKIEEMKKHLGWFYGRLAKASVPKASSPQWSEFLSKAVLAPDLPVPKRSKVRLCWRDGLRTERKNWKQAQSSRPADLRAFCGSVEERQATLPDLSIRPATHSLTLLCPI
jgi:hypothetical protein